MGFLAIFDLSQICVILIDSSTMNLDEYVFCRSTTLWRCHSIVQIDTIFRYGRWMSCNYGDQIYELENLQEMKPYCHDSFTQHRLDQFGGTEPAAPNEPGEESVMS